MSNSTLDILQEVHTLLAKYFMQEIEASMQEDGFPIPSATLGVMVAFLKNNDITADVRDRDGLEELKARLMSEKEESKDRGKQLVEIADRVGDVMGFDPAKVM